MAMHACDMLCSRSGPWIDSRTQIDFMVNRRRYWRIPNWRGRSRCVVTPRITARAYCPFGGSSDGDRGKDRDCDGQTSYGGLDDRRLTYSDSSEPMAEPRDEGG